MKIGLLTYYGDLNCGTNLQAFASLKALREHYPCDEVEIIPFHAFNNHTRPYLTHATPTSLVRDYRRIREYRNFKARELGVSKDIVITNIEKALQHIRQRNYDIIYVGADTILELDRLPHDCDRITAYWLSPEIKARKILLAASCKNTEYEKLLPRQRDLLDAAINDFAAWGIRDITTHNLLSNFIEEQKIELLPDPTFTLDIDYTPIEKYLDRNHIDIPRKTICFHTYRTDTWAPQVAAQLRAQGYTIASLRPAPWADIVLNGLSPLEQLGVYRYFSLIITHRFHDSIFALKNGIPPLTYVADASYTTHQGHSKCSSLIRDFDLYPLHIIEQPAQLTAQSFVQKAEEIINSYDKHKNEVAKKIEQFAQRYHHFIESNKNG